METKIIVSASDAGQRLDKFLLSIFRQYSRAFLKNNIKQGNFLVNNKKVKPSYLLKTDEQISLAPNFILPKETTILPNPEIKLKIIYEDDDVIVIDKPAGLITHPRQDKNGLPIASEIKNTLASALLAYYPPLASVGDSPALRPGIVHRLDKDTSGIMIFAKNQKSFMFLKKQFQEKKVRKKYLALVLGHLKEKSGQVKTSLIRSKSNPTKQKITQKGGKEAITEYRLKKEINNYSLLEVFPKTGRLHQIRVHFAWLGHPIAGDKKYGHRQQKKDFFPRQFLHAAELVIKLPNGAKKTFFSPLPTDLVNVLNALEKSQK